MRLTVVGCAGSAPEASVACSCYLVERDGYRLLLDLGTGASGPLLRYTSPERVDRVVVSHTHADHYADLQVLAYHRGRLGAGPVNVVGPGDLRDALSWLTTSPRHFTFTKAETGTYPAGPMTLRLAPVQHGIMDAWAVRVDDALCYTGDTEPCPELDELAVGCEVLLAEACYPHDKATGRHLSGREAGELATRAGARLLIITHLREWTDPDRILAEAAEHAACPVVRAVPGLRVYAVRGTTSPVS
jgi:ribonuclease BN (tRNA processing enzyme)